MHCSPTRKKPCPAFFSLVAPAESQDEWAYDESIETRVEARSFEGKSVQPRANLLAIHCPIAAGLACQVAADGVFQRVIVVEQSRGSQKLQSPHAGVPDDMN